jgi:DNA ligase (NAD+)
MISFFTLEWLRSLGLKTGRHNSKAKELKGAKRYHEEMMKKRDSIEYEIDGIVIKIDSYKTRQELGVRQRNPKWAIAWKFPPKQEKTTIQDITVQVGRTGMLTPVALLSPVDIGGVTVSRATLHNEDYVKEHDFRKNDIVQLKRAGDVIPEVVSREGSEGKRGKRFSMPKRCPACKSPVIKEGAYYFCDAGLSCPAQLKGHIMHFASRAAMDIQGIGDKVAEMIVNLGLVKDVSGLYKLKKHDLLKLDGFSEKSAQKLYSQVQDARKADLDRFLYSLGIRHVGEHIARVVASRFNDIGSIRKAKKNDFESAEEIGPQIAESLEAFFKKNREIVDSLLDEIDVKGTKKKEKSNISGRNFVFTGSLGSFRRDEAKRAVERAGAKASGSVSSRTDYLVAGKEPGSKLEEAKKQDIKILSEKDFKKMIGGG